MITLRFPLRRLLVAAVAALGMFGAMIIASGPAAAYPPTESYPTNAVSDPRAPVVAPPHSGGSFKGDISVDYCYDGYYAIGRGLDDAIWASAFNGSTWSEWKSLGGSTSSTPVLYNTPRLAPNYCVIYIRAKKDNKLNFADLKPGLPPASWTATPMLLGAEPTIAFYNGSDTMAVRGTDGVIYTGNLTIGGVASWTSQGGLTGYAPALRGEYAANGSFLGWCVSVIGVDLTATRGAWWEKCSYGTNANLWMSQGGVFQGTPGSFYSSLYGYSIRGARASDNTLFVRTNNTGWFTLGGPMTTDRPGFGYNNYPGGTGKLWVGVLRSDGRTWQRTNTDMANINSWAAFAKLG